MPQDVLIAGATGYMGQRLIADLVARHHSIRALARPGSEKKFPSGIAIVSGDPLRGETFSDQIGTPDTWVHLVGVPHPSPSKAEQFKAIDLKSIEAAVPLAVNAGVKHFVYVSVAHPAPMMHAYIEVRERCEEIIRQSGLHATILRPWYVLGPGHRWPYLLLPFYALAQQIPSMSASAKRLGLVTLPQMTNALVYAVEHPPDGVRVLEVPEIKRLSTTQNR